MAQMPGLDRGLLHSLLTALNNIFMARAKKMTERVHPIVIPFSSRCQSDVISPEVDSKPEILIVIQDKALDLARHMVSVQGSLNQLIRYRTIGFFKPKHNKVSLPFASLLYQLSDSCVFQTHCHTRDASFPN